MDSLIIKGGSPLSGKIKVSGAKNAALPLMAAGLLLESGNLELLSMPNLADTQSMRVLINSLGLDVNIHNNKATISGQLNSYYASYDLVRKMRASILVLGPLLARLGIAKVSLPGGCSIGTRPVDLHIKVMESLGAKISLKNGYIEAKSPKGGLKGNTIVFPKISVGATENAIMAASIAKGKTILINAAKEPEILNLADCLNKMGAEISGAGSNKIIISGVKKLYPTSHKVISDRIEAGSFAIAAAITNSKLELTNCNPQHLLSLSKILIKSGVLWESKKNSILISPKNEIQSTNIKTEEYPGFPTDLQAQFMALMCIAKGSSSISETIFENRFMHIPELIRMGANIIVKGGCAKVKGVPFLKGAPLMATDLRASISLIIAALSAKGESRISRIYHLDRGYENLEKKLVNCGASIRRVKSNF